MRADREVFAVPGRDTGFIDSGARSGSSFGALVDLVDRYDLLVPGREDGAGAAVEENI
jgi:hypothetical protein